MNKWEDKSKRASNPPADMSHWFRIAGLLFPCKLFFFSLLQRFLSKLNSLSAVNMNDTLHLYEKGVIGRFLCAQRNNLGTDAPPPVLQSDRRAWSDGSAVVLCTQEGIMGSTCCPSPKRSRCSAPPLILVCVRAPTAASPIAEALIEGGCLQPSNTSFAWTLSQVEIAPASGRHPRFCVCDASIKANTLTACASLSAVIPLT